MRRELLTDLGNLAPRISFCPYFLQLYPSSKDPSSPVLEQIFTCSVHLGMVFLHATNSKGPILKSDHESQQLTQVTKTRTWQLLKLPFLGDSFVLKFTVRDLTFGTCTICKRTMGIHHGASGGFGLSHSKPSVQHGEGFLIGRENLINQQFIGFMG